MFRKKFSAIDEGSRTNRILHVRYLETSPHWKIHTAREGGGNPSSSSSSLLLPTPPSQDQDQDEEGRVELEQGGQMSTISALYLSTNPDLVRGRVVRALKARKDWWMQQNEMASTIVRPFLFSCLSLSLSLPSANVGGEFGRGM